LGLLALIRYWIASPATQERLIQGPGEPAAPVAATSVTDTSPVAPPAPVTNASPVAPPATTPSATAPPAPAAAGETARQLAIFDEILAARNDNDPRLDTDLKVLNEETKSAFRARYRVIAAERRNDRGTLVFLLGRILRTADDYAFMGEVLSERPCLSMQDCSSAPPPVAGDDHHASGTAITLAYPQLTALKALQNAPKPASPEIAEAARKALAAAKASPTDLVAEYAKKIAP
jgi:hypothetical protein